MIVDDIRESIKLFLPDSEFSYGRKFDTAIEASAVTIKDYFVALDPIRIVSTRSDKSRTASIVMAFLVLDKTDSNYDKGTNKDVELSIEEKQANATLKAEEWTDYFTDIWSKKTGNTKYQIVSLNINPLTRIKDIMSGVSVEFDLIYKRPIC